MQICSILIAEIERCDFFMKTIRTVLISAASLAAVFAVYLVACGVMRAVPVPIKKADVNIVSQGYENDTYYLTVSAKAGGLYCTGCSFRTEGDVLYVTVTGGPDKSDDIDVVFSCRCPDISQVKYEYKWSKESEKSVIFVRTDDDVTEH